MVVLVQSVAGVVIFEADTVKKIAGRYFDPALVKRESQLKFEKEIIAKSVKSSSVLAAAGVASLTEKKDSKEAVSSKDNINISLQQGTSFEQDEILIIDGFIVLLHLCNDVLVSVIAREAQNDLLINEYLKTVYGCLLNVCGGTLVSKKKCFDRLDQVFLIIDETVENGMILEFDVPTIVARINMLTEPEAGVVGGSPSANGRAAIAVRQGI